MYTTTYQPQFTQPNNTACKQMSSQSRHKGAMWIIRVLESEEMQPAFSYQMDGDN